MDHINIWINCWCCHSSSSFLLFHHLLLRGWGTWMDGWRDGWMERTITQGFYISRCYDLYQSSINLFLISGYTLKTKYRCLTILHYFLLTFGNWKPWTTCELDFRIFLSLIQNLKPMKSLLLSENIKEPELKLLWFLKF